MRFSCHKCHSSHREMYYASFLTSTNEPKIGFLCPMCHDKYLLEGRLIGYIAKQDTFSWLHNAITLRSFKEAFNKNDFNYKEIASYSTVVNSPLYTKLERVADIHSCLASSHGFNSTVEGWLFNLSSQYICALLKGSQSTFRKAANERRVKSVLAYHEQLKCSAMRYSREGVIETLLGIISASLSSNFQPGKRLTSRDVRISQLFLQQLPSYISKKHWAYQSLQGLATQNPWIIILTINIDYLPAKDLSRISEMILNSLLYQKAFYRKEAILRSIHWQILLANQLQIPSSRIL